ncbi:uncharacterized protein Dana_GF24597 [Drosophila ananassae]|uniref:Kazal-like domain-containing protein n=1 Tax=Drosophila ananassae TaxID=7217 RepID=B3M3H4_DROAN|nr:ribosome-binding protein 1 [Drosophila ananassae]EDV39235.1 uncharacterized protein Dana_GF24597 [Drosophila ananassae]
MIKLFYPLAAVLLCFVFATAQVVPNTEIGRITIQVPLLSNGKPVILTNQDKEEVAHVEEIKPGKVHVVQEVVVPPTVKSESKVRVARAVGGYNSGLPNPGIPNHGIPNRGIPNDGIPNPGIPIDGIPNPGIPNHGIPNPGIPNHGIPNRGIPNDGIPNPGIPNHGIPNPGIPNHGIPNPGIPHPEASEIKSVMVTTAPATTEMPKRVTTRNCHQLLMGGMTTTSPSEVTSVPVESCDELCTKLEYVPICGYNGDCIHEFSNQCVMDSFNCRHRQQVFRAVDDDVCRLGVCVRRCKEEDLKH